MQETMSTQKLRQMKRGLEGKKREKRYNWIAIYYEKITYWRYSFYII